MRVVTIFELTLICLGLISVRFEEAATVYLLCFTKSVDIREMHMYVAFMLGPVIVNILMVNVKI